MGGRARKQMRHIEISLQVSVGHRKPQLSYVSWERERQELVIRACDIFYIHT